MQRLHFWVGFLGLIGFLLTGQYMDRVYDHLQGMPNATRMLFRSTHIYILLASVINLVLGVYLRPPDPRHKKVMQTLASLLVLASPCLLVLAFFTEPQMANLARPYSRLALYSLFGSAVVFSYLGFSSEDRPQTGQTTV